MNKLKIQIMSLWRNDADRNIEARLDHLLGKASVDFDISWLWITGDNSDVTYECLAAAAAYNNKLDISLIQYDTGIVGEDVATRRLRSSQSANVLFASIRRNADYVMLHESDLRSGVLVIDELLAPNMFDTTVYEFVAGWPIIQLPSEPQPRFYDIWAYRHLDGSQFSPYERRMKSTGGAPRNKFQVSSFGSVWIAPAKEVRNRTLDETCIVGLCKQWTDEGHKLWVEPAVTITQPASLWIPS